MPMTRVERGLNDVIGDGAEFVDFHDAFDLGEEPVDDAEVASGDAGDGGNCLGERAVFVGESDPCCRAVGSG
jgi:hypothetical protein